MKMNEAQPHHTDTCVCVYVNPNIGASGNLIGWILRRNERTYRDIIISSRYINNLPPPSEEEKASKKFFKQRYMDSSSPPWKKNRHVFSRRVDGEIKNSVQEADVCVSEDEEEEGYTHIRYPVWTIRPNVCVCM